MASKPSDVGEMLLSKKGTKYIRFYRSVEVTKTKDGKTAPVSVFFEDPKAKFVRIIDSPRVSDETRQSAQRQLESLPDYVLARLVVKAEE